MTMQVAESVARLSTPPARGRSSAARKADSATVLGLLAAALLLLATNTVEAQVASGTYTGNGVAGRRITGLGFRPDVVLIKGADQDLTSRTNTATIARTSSMVGDTSKPMVLDNALVANQVRSLDVDGFTVGNDRRVNTAAACVSGAPCNYFWVAFKADADLKVGTYTGNGATQSITGLGFSPDFLILLSASAKRAIMATSAAPAGRSFEFESNIWLANQITSLDPTGFTVNHNAGLPYANESSVTYHYIAWRATPLKTFVGSYNGDGTDFRNITGVGFQPKYLIVKPIYNNDAVYGPTFTPPASQRYAAMTGDSMYNFTWGPATKHIEAFLTDGFQVGNATSINRQYIDCDEDGGAGCAYFYVAFDGVAPAAPLLSTTQSGGTITVTAPNSFEVVFDANYGGGVTKFYDLAADHNRQQDLAGGTAFSGAKTLYHSGIQSGAIWYTPDDNTADPSDPAGRWSGYAPRLEPLEVTPTRVRIRQEAYFARLCDTGPPCTPGTLPGIFHIGDYSVFSPGKLGLFQLRQYTVSQPLANEDEGLGVLSECPGSCPSLTAYSESGQLTSGSPSATPNDSFLLAKRELPGRRTDFLKIEAWSWYWANQVEYDQSVAFLNWRDFPTSGSTPGSGTDLWGYLTYFKPTNLGSTATPWTDPAVTQRATDYIWGDDLATPNPLTAGTGWFDNFNEWTQAPDDFYNEYEGVYCLNMDPSAGLSFEIDGGTDPRYSPFFKIRQWQSVLPPSTVTLGAATIYRDVNYRADVKPVPRAHFRKILWHSTLQNAAAVTAPDIGSAGTLPGGISFGTGKYGGGVQITGNSRYVSIPTAGNFDKAKGALEFWFQPTWNHNDSVQHDLAGSYSSATNNWYLTKFADNSLVFRIVALGAVFDVTVPSTGYAWRAGEWVHLRMEWDDSAPLATQQRLYVNGFECPHTDAASDYNSANLTLGTDFRIGNAPDGNAPYGDGIYDEVYSYGGSSTPDLVAYGGFVGNGSEYLDDPGNNVQLAFTAVDASRRGEYLFIGSETQFRGLNVTLKTPGVGVAAGALEWEYWNGAGNWASLETVTGFTDTTNSLTEEGSISWTGDPATWYESSFNGSSSLFWIRVHLGSGTYAPAPTEGVIRTDILLFQYMGDLTSDGQKFTFAAPVPTAVALQSFEATGVEEGVELAWSTASELENLGFHLYRATTESGPYERITASLIPGLGSSATGQGYRYVDTGLTPGVRYYYKLEDIETSGKTARHGPASAVPLAATAGGGSPGSGGGSGTGPDPTSGGGGTGTGPTGSSGKTYGDPGATSVRVVERTADHVDLELFTGGFAAIPEGEGVRLSIPGFEETTRAGYAALPLKRVMVEAVAGRRVCLASVETFEEETFPGLRPVGSKRLELAVTAEGTVKPSSRRTRVLLSDREETSPAARLSGVFFQGEVKKAGVEFYPLRWDGTVVRLFKRVRVRLSFAGVDPSEEGLGGSRGRRRVQTGPHRSGTVAEIVVKGRGLYRVDYEDVFGGGDVLPGRRRTRAIVTSRLRLSRQGQAVGYHVEPRNSAFVPGSSLYFFSEGSSLNPYGDAVYELETDEAGPVMPVVVAAATGTRLSEYEAKGVWEENHYYQAGLLEAEDLWQWDLVVSPASKTYPFTLSGVMAGSAKPVRVVVWLQGASDFETEPDHHVRVKVNESVVGEGTWSGRLPYVVEGELGAGILQEGENQLEVENVGDTPAAYSMVFLNKFSVEYPRSLSAEGGVLEGRFDSGGRAEVGGLSSGTYVLDVTESLPRWVVGGEPTATGYAFGAEGGRSYLVVDAGSVLRPQQMLRPLGSTLRDTAHQVDYLVVGPRAFLEAAQPLLELRRSQGLSVLGASTEEIEQEFGHGEEGPGAIKEFLRYAYQSWARPSMTYVLLLGDATYDPKNYLKTGVKNQVPPLVVKTSYLWTASDPAYGALNGEDLLPDVALGRLSAGSVSQVVSLVQKIVSFETEGQDLSGEAVLVADNPDLAGDFEKNADELAGGVLSGRTVSKIYLSQLGAGTRPAIVEAFDRGPGLMSYIGHGGTVVWATENVFNNSDVPTLSLQAKQPLLLTMNCMSGFFHFPPMDSLAEAIVKAEGKGAIAAFSPSGLSLDEPAHVYQKALLGEIVSGRHERLGDAILAAQGIYADSGAFPELLSIYHLLGDPALKIQ